MSDVQGDESNIDAQNASSTGALGGMSGVTREVGRQSSNPINYHRGLFALMAAFDWDKGRFSERMEDVALRNEGLTLLGLPTNLPATMNPDAVQMSALIEELTGGQAEAQERYFREGARQEAPGGGRSSADYVQGLVNLSKAVSKNRALPEDAKWENPLKKKKKKKEEEEE